MRSVDHKPAAKQTVTSLGEEQVGRLAPTVSHTTTALSEMAHVDEEARTADTPLPAQIPATASRLTKAQHASKFAVANASIDPPRVVVRQRQRPGSAPTFSSTKMDVHAKRQVFRRKTTARKKDHRDDMTDIVQPRKSASGRRRQRRSASHVPVPVAVSGSKQWWQPKQFSAEFEQRTDMSTRALHHLEVYTTTGQY